MTYNKLIAIATLLIATTVAFDFKVTGKHDFSNDQQPLSKRRKRWTPVNLFDIKANGTAQVLHFDSLNAQAGIVISDNKANTCYVQAIVNETVYGVDGDNVTPQECTQAVITKLGQYGQILVTTGSGVYIYTRTNGDYSGIGQINSDGAKLSDVIAQGVEVGITKSTDGVDDTADYFRVFSRASDINNTYPTNFYALIANSTGDTFAVGGNNTLTLKKFAWTFKNTSTDVKFTQIEQVNFVSDHDPRYVLEAQWITGKGRINAATEESGLEQLKTTPACQYGAVNTRYFALGPNPSTPIMYGYGHLHFPCNLTTTPARTYQGVVSFTDALNYFYAIDPVKGNIQVCTHTPRDLDHVAHITDFTTGCFTTNNTKLVLGTNEYYSAVGILGTFNSDLTIVNIKVKGDPKSLRQVVLSFSTGDLPTFDTDTYFYTVYEKTIWRIKQKFAPGEILLASYFLPANLHGEKKDDAVIF